MANKNIRIGIQGGRGSTNERAAHFFAKKYGWKDYEIVCLITTEKVLKALQKNQIDYGTFAWKSSRGGLVRETQDAIQVYPYRKVDEHEFQVDHVLLSNGSMETEKTVHIFSHPQAILEHTPLLRKLFPKVEMHKEIDTGIAANKLKLMEYPKNSLVIAPHACAEIYDLQILLSDLPTNQGYKTTIYFVRA